MFHELAYIVSWDIVEVVGRSLRHRQHRSAARVEHNTADRLGAVLSRGVADGLLRKPLYRRVNSEPYIHAFSGRDVICVPVFQLPADKVCLGKRIAVPTRKILIVLQFQSALPRVVGVGKAYGLSQKVAVRIISRAVCREIYAREVLCLYIYLLFASNLPAQPRLRHALFHELFEQRRIIYTEQLRYIPCGIFAVFDIIGSAIHGIGSLCRSDYVAVDVGDIAPICRKRQIASPLLIRKHLQAWSVNNLHIKQSARESAKK